MRQVAIGFALLVFSLSYAIEARAQDPITEVIKKGIKKVIKAVDLQIQRFQNEIIWLQNAQKTIENTMSKLRLDEITDWVEKQRQLYAGYFEELWKVKSIITYYHRVRDIINKQKQIIAEYKRACQLVQQDKNFTTEEISFMYRVYSEILNESGKNIDQVFIVINSFATQMSDAKRLEIINTAADKIDQNISDLRDFNWKNILTSMQRTKDLSDVEIVKKLYGLD